MVSITTFFSEAVIFALYIFVCLVLLKPRFALWVRILAYGGVLLCTVGAVTAFTLAGNGVAALTLMPFIAYLPFSVCAYILSNEGVFKTATACSVGALSSLIVKTLKKTLSGFFGVSFLSGEMLDILYLVVVTVFAAVIAFSVFKLIRKPFGVCMRSDVKNRLIILVPATTIFLLIFNNLNSTFSIAVSVMTLIVAVSFFIITLQLFVNSAKIAEAEANERRLFENLNIQRQNFEKLSESVDAGRHYRHDMRHHLNILAGMAQQNNSDEILEYIEELNNNAEICAPEMFCSNPAINAVISEGISRAKKLNCNVEYKLLIPEDIPFDLPDVCIILSNALENALNACEKCPSDKRCINLSAVFSDNRKLMVYVGNSCADTVEIDSEGLPIIKEQIEGHGIGLRGVNKLVKKYNGFLCCSCENGEFGFYAEIFRTLSSGSQNSEKTLPNKKPAKALTAVLSLMVCSVVMLNVSPVFASALSEILSFDIKTITYGWGDNVFNAEYPEFGGESSDKANEAFSDFIGEARKNFMQYALQKYEGYVAEDAGYRIHMNNTTYLSARFYATVNLGGSFEYSRCVTIDKQNNKVLALSDLFDEDRDYIAEISAEVLRQMEYRVQYEDANYFIPGGIWSEEECFKEISPDQEFYLTIDGRLVIVFEEYTVAAGTEGSPEFFMPYEIFSLEGY